MNALVWILYTQFVAFVWILYTQFVVVFKCKSKYTNSFKSNNSKKVDKCDGEKSMKHQVVSSMT